MKTFFVVVFIFIIAVSNSFGQQNFSFQLVDKETKTAIPAVKATIDSLKLGAIADVNGLVKLSNIPAGSHKITFRSVGYEDFTITMSFPTRQQEPKQIELSAENELDEVIVEGTRTNKSISDSPTRIEALTDEIDEAASMEPGKVSHLITHTTGVQVQTTSASSNGAVIRIQGMNGRYTQLLKDGFPMYGGFSGSLDILQIPPLDLRQVEFIKGPASTLYGGGAIGGIVNLLTKTPTKDEILLHINYSSIGARDFNAFVSRKFGKFGFTNLASIHVHNPYDADGDGFSDMAQVNKFNFNPKLFYSPVPKLDFYFGVDYSKENRSGGDMNRIANAPMTYADFYLDKQESDRVSSQFKFTYKISKKSTFTVKNSVSEFNRYMAIQENLNTETVFAGNQFSSYTEFTYSYRSAKHNLIIGKNLVSDNFRERLVSSSDTARNQYYLTRGTFINYVWDITEKIALESGLRLDYAFAKSTLNETDGRLFLLPRISSLFKLAKGLSLRAGGGMGYRMPTIFNEDSEPIAYKNIKAIDFQNTVAEESLGGNLDVKYVTNFGSDKLLFSFNQMFFYNIIDNPILLVQNGYGDLAYQNYGKQMHSRGFESQLKFTFWKITWFLGYTYNQAFLELETYSPYLTLAPQHSIKGDFLFVEENKWRIGLDYEYKSKQWLTSGLSTPEIFMSGIIIERTIGNFVLFFNAENFTDVRQSKNQSLISSPNNTPQNTEIWAPLDGRFLNGGIKIKL